MMLELIPYGKENAISKQELMQLTGLSERVVRKKIHDLRQEYVIISSSHRKGFYRTNDLQEINDFIEETKRRAFNTFKSYKAAKAYKEELLKCDTLQEITTEVQAN